MPRADWEKRLAELNNQSNNRYERKSDDFILAREANEIGYMKKIAERVRVFAESGVSWVIGMRQIYNDLLKNKKIH